MSHNITTEEQLPSLFGDVGEASRAKETQSLHPLYQQWINSSPFAVLATVGPEGLDTSPRGYPAPLVRIVNDKTILLPERRGNNFLNNLGTSRGGGFSYPKCGRTARIRLGL